MSGIFERLDARRRDALFALRQLRREPGLAAAIILTLALALGANATIFGVADRLLLRPPAHVARPAELRRVYVTARTPAGDEQTSDALSFPEYAALRAPGVVAAAAVAATRLPLGTGAGARQVRVAIVTPSFFTTLGVRPALGRFFAESDERAAASVAVVSAALWRDALGADPHVVGRTITLDARRREHYTVVGVAPDGFSGVGVDAPDLWVPMSASVGGPMRAGAWETGTDTKWLAAVVRLAPNADPSQVAANLTAVYRHAAEQLDGVDRRGRVSLGTAVEGRGPGRTVEARVAPGSPASARSSCSSPARTSRTCCSRAPRGAAARSRRGSR